MARGYAGRVLVCGVVLRPIAGYKPDSLLVRYLAGKIDLELWFAPIAGMQVMAPVRALMPTLIGTMDIEANEFVVRHETPRRAGAGEVANRAAPKPVEVARWRRPRQRNRSSRNRDRPAFRNRADDRLEGADHIEHVGSGDREWLSGLDRFAEGLDQRAE